jgi:hypothetical protein
MAIAAEELYAHFGHGEARPEALRDFLAYAFHSWRAPAPRYLLLLGDASYDTKGYLGPVRQPLLPTPLLRSSFLWTASDPSLAAVNGQDGLPDVAIGRLPATTLAEARSLVEKTIAWEESGHSLDGPITLVSDNPDPAGDFEQDADEIARTILASQDVEHLSLARLGTSTTRAAIKDAFERGVSLVSYIGHGAIMLWASEQLLTPADVEALAPQGSQPLVLAMNCLNGYFHLPTGNSLSEKLLKADAKGAVATFSSSGMSFDEPAHRYHKALLAEITNGRHQRLGDALLAAQASYADTGADPELLALYHLLGDPALKIR